jgi:hypothetical protein
MARLHSISFAAGLLSTVVWISAGWSQTPSQPKDEALDSLLEKLDGPKSDESKRSDAEEKSSSKEAAPKAKDADRAKNAGRAKGDASTSDGDVAPKDKALDSLLEKLGETTEEPNDEQPRGGRGNPDGPKPPEPGDRAKDELKPPEKDLDRHLEELTGRRTKKSREQQEDSGPLGQIIKEMRDVEQRLGKSKPDTGDDTRRKQAEIVKKLETLIEQLRSTSGQQQSRRRSLTMRSSKPGGKQTNEPGAQSEGAPNMKPEKPARTKSRAGGRSQWGHLPAELQQEKGNVDQEEELPSQSDLIRRYFLSLDKKYLIRGE